MVNLSTVKRPIIKSFVYTLLLTLVFCAITSVKQETKDILLALPFFFILYFLLFSIGKPEIAKLIRSRIIKDSRISLLFPLALTFLYFIYVGLNGQNPFQNTLFLVPYLLFFPILAFLNLKDSNRKIGWFDFTILFLFIFPITLVKVQPTGELPFYGGGFDSVYRISVMLVAVFAFVIVRNIQDVGFYPVFKLKKLWTVLWVWAIFYGTVILIAYPIDFIKFKGDPEANDFLSMNTARKFLSILLHTALFEELVFRGLLQNMLARRIAEGGNWKVFLRWGTILLILLSLAVGFSMKGSMQWFPAAITFALCGAAYVLELKKWESFGAYTALALTSVVFGLVHAHSGSVIFVGLAAIGGWAYGYTYLKTGNVFYAALLHALVNSTPMLFGLELAK